MHGAGAAYAGTGSTRCWSCLQASAIRPSQNCFLTSDCDMLVTADMPDRDAALVAGEVGESSCSAHCAPSPGGRADADDLSLFPSFVVFLAADTRYPTRTAHETLRQQRPPGLPGRPRGVWRSRLAFTRRTVTLTSSEHCRRGGQPSSCSTEPADPLALNHPATFVPVRGALKRTEHACDARGGRLARWAEGRRQLCRRDCRRRARPPACRTSPAPHPADTRLQSCCSPAEPCRDKACSCWRWPAWPAALVRLSTSVSVGQAPRGWLRLAAGMLHGRAHTRKHSSELVTFCLFAASGEPELPVEQPAGLGRQRGGRMRGAGHLPGLTLPDDEEALSGRDAGRAVVVGQVEPFAVGDGGLPPGGWEAEAPAASAASPEPRVQATAARKGAARAPPAAARSPAAPPGGKVDALGRKKAEAKAAKAAKPPPPRRPPPSPPYINYKLPGKWGRRTPPQLASWAGFDPFNTQQCTQHSLRRIMVPR